MLVIIRSKEILFFLESKMKKFLKLEKIKSNFLLILNSCMLPSKFYWELSYIMEHNIIYKHNIINSWIFKSNLSPKKTFMALLKSMEILGPESGRVLKHLINNNIYTCVIKNVNFITEQSFLLTFWNHHFMSKVT